MRGQGAFRFPADWVATFVAVARHGGFSAAARSLNRAQPNVSAHVAALERAWGVQLFDRSYQPVQLTPEGRAMLLHAEAFLHQLDFLSQMTESLGEVRGTVRVGLYPSVSCWLFPRLLPVIGRLHPQVRLTLWEGQTADLSDALLTGAVDLAVRPLIPLATSDRLQYEPLWREPLVAVVAPGHPLARLERVTPADAARYDLVTVGGSVTPGTAYQFEVGLAFAQAGLRPTIAYQTNQPQTLVNLARLSGFVGLTNVLAAQTADHAGVVMRPIDGEPFTRTVGLWRRVDAALSPAVEAVHEAVLRLGAPEGAPDVAASGPPDGEITPRRGTSARD
ncbi:LysR family transcriptional regulator [Cellulosimicrobium cellulans]|uniref:LysR family transcriptional regulator n=1 Tax=Cellulosimicrobium cellulans TaxID=1710 RepID=UPI00130D6AF5|nr:LysR family transcriptional regulator [Cellulosimicrobium cellulans]